MQQINSMLQNQKQKTQSQSEVSEDIVEMIKFETDGSAYMVPLDKVREIADVSKIVPFPEKQPGYIGLVSLRGELLPVLSMSENAKAPNPCRVVVLEFNEGMRFCLCVSNVKKVILDTSSLRENNCFDIDNIAVKLLQVSQIPSLKGVAA